MTTEKELMPLKKKVQTLADKVGSLEIKNAEDLKNAVSILSQMNQYADSVKEKKELLTKPLNEALKAARDMFKPIEETYDDAIQSLRSKMSAYQTEQVRIQKEEETKIANRIGEGKGKLKIEKAMKKMESVVVPSKEVASTQGLVQFREVKKFEVVDIKALPLEYLMPNEALIQKAMKEGKELKGVRYFIDLVPVNYR